ncbi:Microtubule-destabilizing protein 60 [Linum perenne]
MDSSIKKNRKPTTPVKESRSPHGFQSKPRNSPAKVTENANPNLSRSISMAGCSSCHLTKSGGKSQKSGQKNPNSSKTLVPYSPRNKLQHRKFVVVKKKNPRKEDKVSSGERLFVAYESLRAQQEEFFKIRNDGEEEPRKSAAKVSGMQPPLDSSSSFCPSEMFLAPENLGVDSRLSVSSSWDANQGSISRTSNGGNRTNSSESCATMGGSRWKKKQQKVTSLNPFQLRTEQRGKMKEEEFLKKIHEMMTEEKRLLIPIAQGLPLTTDEPEHLIKPPVKESTRPIDLTLHSDVRAEERAEFNQQVLEKLSLYEKYKMERERLQKVGALAEEEEVRRLRKELIPKAQPLPYFDRPFIPRRSMKQPTIPKEPRFHVPHHKQILE